MIRGSSRKRKQLVLVAYAALLLFIAVVIVATTVGLVSSLEREESSSDSMQREVGRGREDTEYVLPDSNSRYYSKEELDELSTWELYIAQNEIYARHGRAFNREDLVSYFSSCTWYKPAYAPEEFDSMPSPFNECEQKNSETIAELRRERNDPTL